MGRPASSTIVRSPFSVSSFAAQPPEIPEPTTMASNVNVVMASGGWSEGQVAVIAVEEDPRLEHVVVDLLRREVAVHRELLETPESESGAFRILARGVQCREELHLACGRQIDETRLRLLLQVAAAERRGSLVDVGETGEERRLVVVRSPLAEN